MVCSPLKADWTQLPQVLFSMSLFDPPTSNSLVTSHHVLIPELPTPSQKLCTCRLTSLIQKAAELLSSLLIFSNSSIIPPLQHYYWEVSHLKLLPYCYACLFASSPYSTQSVHLSKKDNKNIQ